MERKAWVEGSGHNFRILAKGNQSLEKWISAKGQWCTEQTEKRCGQYTMASSSLFCQSAEMKTCWVEEIDFREVEEWGQSKE